MGAWIEIARAGKLNPAKPVAPHMGAWIEIINKPNLHLLGSVAPHMGAWIEIMIGLGKYPLG